MIPTQLPAPKSNRGGARPNTGGARPGSGRPPGSKTKKTQLIAEAARDEGVTPIEVMLGNMRYYHARAESVERNLELVANSITKEKLEAGGEEVITLLKLVKEVGNFRMQAQTCAVDAAPYVHPRLAALAVKVTSGDSKKPPVEITRQMVPQLAADAYADFLANED